jgi:hypothetical protein
LEVKSIAFTSAIDEYSKMLKSQEPGKYDSVRTTASWAKVEKTEPVMGIGSGGYATTMTNFIDNDQFRKTQPSLRQPLVETRMSFQPS